MRKNAKSIAARATAAGALGIAALLLLPACGADEPVPERATETVTVVSSESETTGPNPTRNTTAATPAEDNRPRGYTGAPTGDPTPLNKTIARCAKSSEGLYEQGTTWFTDGTSGWTEYCSNTFYDGPPPTYEPTTQNTPSPWVQGQIDWAECIESGKSEEQCRAELN